MDTLSPIYVMGGWPTQGWTETNLNPFEVSVFDVAHNGQPSSVTLAQYRKTTDDGTDLYLPRAQRLWLNLISFDYPMKWSNTAFNFTSRGPVQTDLLVVNTQHELTFLDAHSAEITFGVRYDGLPEISLSNLAFNALDDATGVFSAVVAAAGNTVFNALESGVSEFNYTLSDEADPLLGRALDAAVDLPLDGLISTVKAQMADGVWTATDIQNAITSYLIERVIVTNTVDVPL